MTRWWLSFADPARPRGQQFLGVAIVKAPDFLAAVLVAHDLNINPGGEVKGFGLPSSLTVPADKMHRLLTEAEAREVA